MAEKHGFPLSQTKAFRKGVVAPSTQGRASSKIDVKGGPEADGSDRSPGAAVCGPLRRRRFASPGCAFSGQGKRGRVFWVIKGWDGQDGLGFAETLLGWYLGASRFQARG